MRRHIAHFNSLLLGMILGAIFIALLHTQQSHQPQNVSARGIAIGYEIVGEKDETTVLLIAGTTTHLVHLPAGFCSYLRNEGCRASSYVTSASLVRPAAHPRMRK